MPNRAIILDTNVFVAAGFNRRSSSARIVQQIRSGKLQMVWHETTRQETQHILTKIPRLAWEPIAELFHEENRHRAPIDLAAVAVIPDYEDRKFAALALATQTQLISNDRHLLDFRDQIGVTVLSPSEFWSIYQQ